MRFKEYLTEADGQYGIVISKQKTGKFEDLELYDIAADNIATGRGHAQNLFGSLVNTIRNHEAWADIEKFLQANSSSHRPLGPEYADNETFDNILYGPFTMEEIGQLGDKFDAMYRNDDPTFVDQEDR